MKQKVCILGSTGSIGCSTLDVIRRNLALYQVEVLTANTNVEKLFHQCMEFNPQLAVMSDVTAAKQLESRLKRAGLDIQVQNGSHSVVNAANFSHLDVVVAAIVGAAGLLPTLTAVKAGLKVLLANKEALVMSGDIFTQAVSDSGAVLLPIDSEHNAIFQCLPESQVKSQPSLKGVRKILLTGSGGPFRTIPLDQLNSVTPEQACIHPNWDMGKKISVDSATMMNKGLELIEACYLFNTQLQQIDIVVHPQSIVHSMVSFDDGSVIAQLGNPDMRTPIAHALAWPERIESGVKPLDFSQLSALTFEQPDYQRFPCIQLAAKAMQAGGIAPCVLNAANEIAVTAFLENQISFPDIAKVIEQTLELVEIVSADSLDIVLSADAHARDIARDIISKGANHVS